MKKGEIYEGVIEKVDFPNKGYVNIDGEKVIVKNGIPGQKVRFMINKKRSGRVEGRLLEVLEKSPLEVREPVCSIFPACGVPRNAWEGGFLVRKNPPENKKFPLFSKTGR